ncbi:DMT family transporter [Haloterrigena salinisoli]|uniref:DMT family transporter n=1 Tax=Haloterrigena salinisoli TaxID=3132747 RepID=UPI0030CF2BE7
MNSTQYRDFTLFISLALMWGTAFPAVEAALSSMPPLLIAAVRFDLVGLFMLGYALMTTESWQPSTRGDILAIVGGGILFVPVGQGIWYIGQELTTSALSGLMASLIPLFTAAWSWVLVPEDRVTGESFAGLSIGFAGVLLVLIPGATPLFSQGVLGKLLLFVSAIGTALGSVLIRRAENGISTPAVTAWSMLLGAGLMHVLSPAIGESLSDVTINATVVLAVGYLTVVSTALAYIVYFTLLNRRSAVEINLVHYLFPVVAIVAGYILFGDTLPQSAIAGFVLIVAGFGILKRRAIVAELGNRDSRDHQ